MLRVVTLALACTACFAKAPPFDDIRPTSGGQVGIGGDGIASGPGFELKFAQTGVKLPTSLTVGDIELFDAPGCGMPSPVGTALVPLQTVKGGPSTEPTFDEAKNFLTIDAEGPAVVKTTVHFEVPYACGGTANAITGTAQFVIYPSGRIVRTDRARAIAQSKDADGCGGCGGQVEAARPPVFESFWQFDELDVQRTVIDVSGNAIPITGDQPLDASAGCASYEAGADTRTVGVRWIETGRARTQGGQTVGVQFAYDLAATVGTTVVQGEQAVTSVVALERGAIDCATVVARTQLPELETFDGAEIEVLQLDPATQFYSGFGEYDSGPFEIRTQTGAGFTEGFAVELDLGDLKHLDVRRKSGVDVRYTLQRRDSLMIIWFDGGIAAGDSIVLEVL